MRRFLELPCLSGYSSTPYGVISVTLKGAAKMAKGFFEDDPVAAMKHATDELDWILRDAIYTKRQVIIEIEKGTNRYEVCAGTLYLK